MISYKIVERGVFPLAVETFYFYDFEKNNTYPQDVELKEPRQCMHCNQTGVQNFISGIITGGTHDKYSAIAVFTCPLCSSTSIHYLIQFKVVKQGFHHSVYESVNSIPHKRENNENISFELEIQFPDFFEIYYQSEKAENENLDQLAGMGYRKALEFLVTDYLLQYPVDTASEDWIKDPRTTLGNKISQIPSSRMQTLAKAASFLGNDETHYTRRHPEHDVESLKAFIKVLLSEIENEIEFRKAEELINKPKG